MLLRMRVMRSRVSCAKLKKHDSREKGQDRHPRDKRKRDSFFAPHCNYRVKLRRRKERGASFDFTSQREKSTRPCHTPYPIQIRPTVQTCVILAKVKRRTVCFDAKTRRDALASQQPLDLVHQCQRQVALADIWDKTASSFRSQNKTT